MKLKNTRGASDRPASSELQERARRAAGRIVAAAGGRAVVTTADVATFPDDV